MRTLALLRTRRRIAFHQGGAHRYHPNAFGHRLLLSAPHGRLSGLKPTFTWPRKLLKPPHPKLRALPRRPLRFLAIPPAPLLQSHAPLLRRLPSDRRLLRLFPRPRSHHPPAQAFMGYVLHPPTPRRSRQRATLTTQTHALQERPQRGAASAPRAFFNFRPSSCSFFAGNHSKIFAAAGLEVKGYRYWNKKELGLDFKGMLEAKQEG